MSEFWKRKMRTYFFRADFNNDGVITKDEWMAMPIQFASFEKADKKKSERLKTAFLNVWEQFMKKAVTGDKERLTFDVFVDSIGKQLYNPELIQHFSGMIRGIFDLVDLNCDGYLQEDEYRRSALQLGVPDASFVKEAFSAIDVNHDGELSIEEFLSGFFDFLFSQDEKSPNALFFGPLIE